MILVDDFDYDWGAVREPKWVEKRCPTCGGGGNHCSNAECTDTCETCEGHGAIHVLRYL